MSIRSVDNLIKVAWNIVNGELDITGMHQWRKQAIEFLHDHLGPDHYYTQCFQSHVKQVEEKDLLAGRGILIAAREAILGEDARV